MYGQWLSINFHYVSGGIGFIYSDDGIYWYSSRDEATPFYDANNDGLRWFATNAVPDSGTPIFQLIISMIPAHRRMSLEQGAVVSGPMILRELPNVPILGTDHRGRIVDGTGALSITAAQVGAQPSDATLTALAGLATGANQLPYSTGTDTFAQTPLSAFARTLLDDADEATARATLGVSGSSIDPSPTGSFYSGSPLSLSIGGYRHIQLWMHAGSGASHNLTITPSGGGSVTIGLGAWNCWVDISFDKYNTCVVRTSSSSGETFNSFASGNSSSITLNSDVPSGWSVNITRSEMS